MVRESGTVSEIYCSPRFGPCLPVCISTVIALKYRDPTMSSSSPQFHRIWIEQCAATKDIREAFGLKNALDYLIGEKLFTFLLISERDPAFATELPAFVSEIRRIFSAEEIHEDLDHMK